MNLKYLLIFLIISLSNAFNPIIPPTIATKFGNQIVKTTSAILPQADAIGHNVLHGNKVLIDYLIDNHNIAMQYKKPIILFLISTAQAGDSAGSHILDAYYNIVNHLL